jgi:hypothetical protein
MGYEWYDHSMATGAGILTIIIPLAAVVAAPFLRHAFDMRREKKYREVVGSLFWGILPFGVASLVWTATGDTPMALNNWLLGTVGAAIGAAAFIYGGYVTRDLVSSARAQSTPTSTTASPTPEKPQPNFRGAAGIVMQGVTNGSIIGNKSHDNAGPNIGVYDSKNIQVKENETYGSKPK